MALMFTSTNLLYSKQLIILFVNENGTTEKFGIKQIKLPNI